MAHHTPEHSMEPMETDTTSNMVASPPTKPCLLNSQGPGQGPGAASFLFSLAGKWWGRFGLTSGIPIEEKTPPVSCCPLGGCGNGGCLECGNFGYNFPSAENPAEKTEKRSYAGQGVPGGASGEPSLPDFMSPSGGAETPVPGTHPPSPGAHRPDGPWGDRRPETAGRGGGSLLEPAWRRPGTYMVSRGSSLRDSDFSAGLLGIPADKESTKSSTVQVVGPQSGLSSSESSESSKSPESESESGGMASESNSESETCEPENLETECSPKNTKSVFMISATPSGGVLVPYEPKELVPAGPTENPDDNEEERERLLFLEQGAFLYRQARNVVFGSQVSQLGFSPPLQITSSEENEGASPAAFISLQHGLLSTEAHAHHGVPSSSGDIMNTMVMHPPQPQLTPRTNGGGRQ